MHLAIKNMVCPRCIAAVENILTEMQLTPASVQLGEVNLSQEMSAGQLDEFGRRLRETGFELLDDPRRKTVERIRSFIIEQVHHGGNESPLNLSQQLAALLHRDYSSLSRLFSEMEGTTIEKFHIAQKIERVKELLTYNELTLSEIAFRMGYSSVAHLSAQFRKVTGLTPTEFRRPGQTQRQPLNEV